MAMSGGSYKQTYNELKVIGSGNFGSATLISPKADPSKFFVAKKVLMGKSDEKELISAKQEAELLKQLKHTHIVEYIDSYIEDGFFIIIMEYCEEGDLAFHIKLMKEKKQYFSEELILNWFLQIVFALGFVHSKRILHRDIKCSNIFLTSHGYVKLGDFGISKILECTMDNASTVTGTPYYMSPEVCESVPYSYKSDVWALGCVLYELCTLKHAFSANSLLNLVYKIIQEKQEPIPEFYSKDLKNLVGNLLTKDYKKRPDINTILQFDFVKEVARKFVEKGGAVQANFVPVIRRTEVHLDRELTAMGEANISQMNAQEKIKLKKRKEAEQEEQRMKQAIMENRSDVLAAKDRKQRQMMSSLDAHKYTTANPMRQSGTSAMQASTLAKSTVGMDKSMEFYGDGTLESKYENTKGGKNNMNDTYKDYPTQTIASMNMETKKFGSKIGGEVGASPSRYNPSDDRPIRASGTYDLKNIEHSVHGEYSVMGDTIASMNLTAANGHTNGTRKQMNFKKDQSEFDTIKTGGLYDQKLHEKVHDEYEDDFEDIEDLTHDDGFEIGYGDEESYRLTAKPGRGDLDNVVNEYKRFITKPKEYQMANSSHFSELQSR